jgi:protein subunit release factor B
MTRKRDKLFSVTIHDCRVDTYRGSGKGGQNRNKRDTAVRVVHEPSGAVGQCEEQRTQWQNKKTAFRRMAETKEFRFWVNKEAARISGDLDRIKQKVEREMKNVKIEIHDEEGRWVECDFETMERK